MWTLNKTGQINLNQVAHPLPTVRGSKLLSRGTIRGNGQFLNPLQNAGLIEVGYAGAAGTILAKGDFWQDAEGTLQFDLGGLDPGLTYDQFYVDDLASLAGTLEVHLLAGFAPSSGDLFRLIDGGPSATRTGTFDALQLPYGPAAWDVIYGPNYVDLRFNAVPEPATWLLLGPGGAIVAIWRRR